MLASTLLVTLVALTSLAVRPAAQQVSRATLTGEVRTPEGLPAARAVVLSDQGGRAVTDADGFFRLELELPAVPRELRVSAWLGAGESLRSATAHVRARGGAVSTAGVLTLAHTGCTPEWLPTFGANSGGSGLSSEVAALAVFDGGDGPMLVVGGEFTSIDFTAFHRIARWDGLFWRQLGSGMNAPVRSLVVLDDGNGAALYAGGSFTSAGGEPANRIARWDGESWSALGSGLDDEVRALAGFDDGNGPALYAGGAFTSAGGAQANRVARWDGASWSPLDGGVSGTTTLAVEALAVYDEGGGKALFAGGIFSSAGGVPAKNIARWDGTSWSALGAGRGGRVLALAVFDDGGGPALYAGGRSASSIDAERIGRWNGASWSPLGAGLDDDVHALTVSDDPEVGGPALYAGGEFTQAGGIAARGVARWDGASWSPLAQGVAPENLPFVFSLAVFDPPGDATPGLFAGGNFLGAGESDTRHLAMWSQGFWSFGRGIGGAKALAVHDDGSGPALFVGGASIYAGSLPVNKIARWDGSRWHELDGGVGDGGFVFSLVVFDDGSGPDLIAGGSFNQIGGLVVPNIARWDGTSWSRIGTGGPGGTVTALEVFDDGSGAGAQLYAGVSFGGGGLKRFNGSSWTALGVTGDIAALTVFDDGSGPALYAAGGFGTVDGLTVNKIARWDGASWSALGDGIPGPANITELAVFDDGSGAALYLAGFFANAGGVVVNNVARWDGTDWSALGSGTNGRVDTLAVFDDGIGKGPALYALGVFTAVDGIPAAGMARWDGASWEAVGGGLGGATPVFDDARVFDDGSGAGPALYVGGSFTISPSGDRGLARWQGCLDTEAPVLTCPGSVTVIDSIGGPPGEIVHFTVGLSDRDPDAQLVCVPPSGSFFARGTTLVTCTATDASGNTAQCQFPVQLVPKVRRP